jgi:signal transduction histidine kinase
MTAADSGDRWSGFPSTCMTAGKEQSRVRPELGMFARAYWRLLVVIVLADAVMCAASLLLLDAQLPPSLWLWLHVACTLMLLLSVALVMRRLVSHHLAGPLVEIRQAAEAISRGELSYRLRDGRRDELGQLGRAINRMAGDLQRTTVSRDYVDSLISNMSDALIVSDRGGRITTVNKAAMELLGGNLSELAG